MDAQHLVTVINACISPDPSTRKVAEDALKQASYVRGGLSTLLHITLEASLPLQARQVAAITIKNCLKRDWEDKESRHSPFIEEDKAIVRNLILEGILRTPPHVRVQLEEAVKCIIATDFPVKWSDLVASIRSSLSSSDPIAVRAALRMLRIIARKYEYKDGIERAPLLAVVEATFPQLIAIFYSLINNPSTSTDLAEMLKLCCKTFYSAIYFEMPPLVAESEQFTGWMSALLQLAARKVPAHEMPQDLDERKQWPWWKVKKWLYRIFYRIFTRYSQTKKLASASEVTFAKKWQEEGCSLRFLTAILDELSTVAHGGYIAPRASNLLLQYVTSAVEHASTWKVLKPHVQELLSQVLIPLLSFDDEDEELWRDDPHEYVRKGYDIIEDIYSPKTGALNVITALCDTRKKTQLDVVMMSLSHVFSQYQAATAAGQSHGGVSEEASRKLDGALLAIGSLSDSLTDSSKYSPQLEHMLQQHIVPLFASPRGYLRAKACWVAGSFADGPLQQKIQPDQLHTTTFSVLFQSVINALNDPELPVQVEAGIAIREFVAAIETENLASLRPLVPGLLERFLAISNEIDSEDLTLALEGVVERFSSEMGPYAIGVVTTLLQQFWKVIQEDEEASTAVNGSDATDADGDDFEGYGSGTLAGYSILSAIITVLEAVSDLQELYPPLEDLLYPVLNRYLNKDGEDIFQELMGIMTRLLFYGVDVSPRMWSLYPKLLQCLEEDWGFEYFSDALLPLDNYISKGTETFLAMSAPPLLDMTNRMLERVLAVEKEKQADEGGEFGLSDMVDNEAYISATQLMSVIMQHCRGRIDACILPYVSLIVARLKYYGKDAEREVQDAFLVAGADALYYNPGLMLTALTALGMLGYFMGMLSEAIGEKRKNGSMRHFSSKREKKVCILGLTSLLSAPASALPPEMSASLGQIASAVVQLLLAFKAQEEKEEGKSDSSDGLSKFNRHQAHHDDDIDDDGGDDDGDNVGGHAARMSRAARKAGIYDADDDEEDDDVWGNSDSDDDGWWGNDDEEVVSPIDAISPYVFFAETLQMLQGGDPGRFTEITSRMDGGTMNAIQGMMAYAMEVKQSQGSG